MHNCYATFAKTVMVIDLHTLGVRVYNTRIHGKKYALLMHNDFSESKSRLNFVLNLFNESFLHSPA